MRILDVRVSLGRNVQQNLTISLTTDYDYQAYTDNDYSRHIFLYNYKHN